MKNYTESDFAINKFSKGMHPPIAITRESQIPTELILIKTCKNCPYHDRCGVVFQKKTALVRVSSKTIQRAAYLKKLSTEEYQTVKNKRNGVEGIPSILRRRYGVDHMPVRGLLRSKCWYNLKIGAINVMRVLAVALFYLFLTLVFVTVNLNQKFKLLVSSERYSNPVFIAF